MVTIKEFLDLIDKKIKKLEEKDSDYTNNAEWIKLRYKQNQAFRTLAKKKLIHFETLKEKYILDTEKLEFCEKKIKQYQKYLGMEE